MKCTNPDNHADRWLTGRSGTGSNVTYYYRCDSCGKEWKVLGGSGK